AAWRALEKMLPVLRAEHGPRFLYLPEGEDPDSLLQREGAEAFTRRLEEDGKPVLNTGIDGVRILAGSGPEGRARMAKKADTMLAAMQDNYLKQAWRQEAELATALSLKAPEPAARKPHPMKKAVSPATPNQERFVAALLQKPERIRVLLADSEKFMLDDDGLNALYTRVLELAAADHAVVQALLLDFPQDERISLWASQSDISDDEFEKLQLLMRERYFYRLMKQSGTLAEKQQYHHRWNEIRNKLEKVGQ
ncbi:MAG: DNA primase, partial [Mariprofundaceae bacterium]|nr:DNA primase [Mariprofundaceae bacterium]